MNKFVFEKLFVPKTGPIWLALFLVCALPGLASAKEKPKWEPIAPEDLAATECKSYPGAGAEILFDRQILSAAGNTQVERYYRRIKIYSSVGAAAAGVLNIEYPSEQNVWVADARVTKPNGTVAEYTKKDFTESVAAKTGSFKIKKLALAVPDLGSGDILEMIWNQTVDNFAGDYRWWYCQRPLPVREFVFAVESSTRDFSLIWFNVTDAKIVGGTRTAGKLVIKNLPPFEEEPNMPPMRDVRGWFLVLYKNPYMRWYDKKDEFWQLLSSYFEEDFRLLIKPNSTIKAKSAELVSGLTTDDEKLRALYDFSRKHVTNFVYFDSAELQAAKKKVDDDDRGQSPSQTLSLKTGYSHHVNELFASLAKAAGYEVKSAWSASRDATFNVRNPNGWLFMDRRVVLVRVGNTWSSFSPGDYYIPAGMLHQSKEAAPILILDPDKVIFDANPTATADKTPLHRKGRFALDAEGNLEGDVELSFGGHSGSEKKEEWADKQVEEVDTGFREEIAKRLPAAEITELAWENLKGTALPLIARFKIKVPAYADVAGTKLILSPNVFEHGAAAAFASATRKFSIFFPYARAENDDIEITLPENYTLDAGSAPANVGDIAGAVGVKYHVGFKPKAHVLTYKRDFALGANGAIAFQAASYGALKKIFDAINRSDEHTLVLKRLEVVPSEAPADASSPAK